MMKKLVLVLGVVAVVIATAALLWHRQGSGVVPNTTKAPAADGGTRAGASVPDAGGGSDFPSRPAGDTRPVTAVAGTLAGDRRDARATSRTAGGAAPGVAGIPTPLWHPGEEAVASVTTADGHTTGNLQLNQVNTFVPRVNIQPQETVTVTVSWPQGSPGEKVVAAVEDGGSLAMVGQGAVEPAQSKGERVLKLTLDEQRAMRFVFTGSEATGIARVTLRKGAETKTVQFWAGPEPQLAEAK